MANKSIQQIFSSQVIYFALVPLALVFIVVCFVFVQDGIDKTKKTSLWQARSIALEMRQKLDSVRNFNQRHSEIDFLGKSAVETGLASMAIKHLQGAVLDNELISAALVLDLKGRTVQSYPFPWFSAPADNWSAILQNKVAKKFDSVKSDLYYLDLTAAARTTNKKYQKVIGEGPFLVIASPLIIKQDSFTEPYVHTGFIVYLCPLSAIVNASLNSGVDLGAINNINILLGNSSVFSLSGDRKTNLYEESTIVDSVKIGYDAQANLLVQSQNSLFDNLAAAYVSFISILFIFFAVAYVVVMHSRRIKTQIDEPIRSIVKDCELIAQGDNAFSRKIYPFFEFQVIHDALEKMSVTITSQLESINLEKDKAKNSENVKSQFLANMSHEIRTPINGIIGMLTLVEKTSLTNEQKRKIGLAQQSAKSLISLINDILDFSKIEAEKMELEYIEFNLMEMLDSLYEIMNVKASDKGVELYLDTHKMQVRTAIGDEGRIRQILLNIIGNAIKFTEKGGVRVITSYYVDHQNKGLFVCEVRDTGIGMNDEQLKAIFHNFAQADSSTTRKFGGTGLGLAISKKLTELMNGNISVESQPGKGSRFTLEIPLEPGEDAYPVNSSLSPAEAYGSLKASSFSQFKNKKILLVEDNEINQEVVFGLLEEADLKVDVAADGLQALNKIKKNHYALILMDCQMPVLDGFQAAQAIRAGSAGDAYRKIPIIALTANAFTQDKQKCLDAGMDDYLSKPVDEQALLEKIYKYLDIGKSHWQGNEVAPMSELNGDACVHPSEVLEHWDKPSALNRVKQRTDRLNRLLEMFLEGTPSRMRALTYAVDKQDYPEVKLIAHSIKGVAANLSANKLNFIAAQMELAVIEGKCASVEDWMQKLIRENSVIVEIFEQELSQADNDADASASR